MVVPFLLLFYAVPVFLYQIVFSLIPYQRRRNEVLGMLGSLANTAFMCSFGDIVLEEPIIFILTVGSPAIMIALMRLAPRATTSSGVNRDDDTTATSPPPS